MRNEMLAVRSALAAGVLAGGVLWAQVAAPAEQGGAAAPAPSGLMHYCAKADTKAAIQLQGKLERLEHGVAKAELERLRGTTQYRTAYRAVTVFVAKVDPHNAARPCREALNPKRPAVPASGKPRVDAG
jgi:hypothetical protein